MKKITSIILTIALLVTLIPITASAEGYDKTAPVVNMVTINKSTVNVPGSFSLTFNFTEEDTGVNKIFVWFSDANGSVDSNDVNAAITCAQNGEELATPMTSGEYTLTFQVSDNCLAEALRITQIDIYDQAGNHRPYYWYSDDNNENGNYYLVEPFTDETSRCYINNSNTIALAYNDPDRDKQAPVINSVSISKATLQAPGTFSIDFDFVEEGSGVSCISVWFGGNNSGNYVDANDINQAIQSYTNGQVFNKPMKTGTYKMDFSISTKCPMDMIQIDQISISDKQGNTRIYYWNSENIDENGTAYLTETNTAGDKCYINNENKIIITFAGDRDTIAPFVNSVRMSKSSLTTPGVFTLTFDFTEEGSGLNCLSAWFVSQDSQYDQNDLNQAIWSEQNYQEFGKPLKSGTYKMTFAVSTKYLASSIQIGQIDAYDKQGNHRTYWIGFEPQCENGVAYLEDMNDPAYRCYINNNNTIDVHPEFDINFQGFITNATNAARLEAMPEGQVAMINYNTNNYTAKAELFDAIRGKDKTIVFSNNAYQWVINGKNIIHPSKDVKLLFSFKNLSMNALGVNETGTEVSFGNNGLLPGRMEIRLKSDYLYNKGKSAILSLYYRSGWNLIREDNPAFDLVLDGTDKWCHFYVTHNSKFYITTKAKAAKIIIKQKNPFTAKAKTATIKRSKIKKKAQTIKRAKAIAISKAKGAITYKKVSVNKKKFAKKFTVNKKTGNITIKKGLKKGTYKVKIKATAAGNKYYKVGTRTVTVIIKVR